VAYGKIREKAETLFRDDPYKSSKEIVEDLLELCPEQRMPHPRTVDNWRNEDRLPRKTSPQSKDWHKHQTSGWWTTQSGKRGKTI
jgi:hypothetical protein